MSELWEAEARRYDAGYDGAGREGRVIRARQAEALELLGDGPGRVVDVGMGGGRLCLALTSRGWEVSGIDPSEAMVALARSRMPDTHERLVVGRAEALPFADGSFDAVATRVAAHHFDDVPAAVHEMARVSSNLVLVVDNLFMSDAAEEADKLRDPSHVRNYTGEEWRAMLGDAGVEVEEVRRFDKPIEFQPWLDRVGCEGEDAERVRELLADRIEDGWVQLDRIAVKGRKA